MRRTRPVCYRLSLPLAAMLLAAPAAGADAPVTVAVRPTVAFAGGEVRTTVRTPRDARNRELRIIVEAPEYYASSDVQLDGVDAAATHQFTWKQLPGGAYRVEAILMREDGHKETYTSCFAVIGADDAGSEAVGAARRGPTPQGDHGGC
jgi:hypothetical protein